MSAIKGESQADPMPHSFWQLRRDKFLLNLAIPSTYNKNMNIDSLTIGEAKELVSKLSPLLNSPVVSPLPFPYEERAVVVCTDKRGVFFGYAKGPLASTIKLRSARNAYYWANAGGGVMCLACDGPAEGSKIGRRADIEISGVTCVMECTANAILAWEDAKWK